MSSIEERLDQERDWQSWVPDSNDEKFDSRNPIVGRLVDKTTVTGGQYGDSTVMVLECTEDPAASFKDESAPRIRLGVWLNRTVLRNEVINQNPQWGEAVGIKYNGEVEAKGGGAKYHSYKVVVDRPIEDRGAAQWGDSSEVEPAMVVYGQDGAPDQAYDAPPSRTPSAVVSSPDDDDIPFD
jgi:hypothetical protein